MALPPVRPQAGRSAAATGGEVAPRTGRPAPVAPLAPAAPAARPPAGERRERRVGRLPTAITESEIARQVARFMRLIAAGTLDRHAPPGSHLNFLV